jgi:hypothetical protein
MTSAYATARAMRQWGEPSAQYRIRQTSTEGNRLLGTLAREIAAEIR